jgi:RND family efflux transporter MFP subunit
MNAPPAGLRDAVRCAVPRPVVVRALTIHQAAPSTMAPFTPQNSAPRSIRATSSDRLVVVAMLVAAAMLAAVGCREKHPTLAATPPAVVMVSQPVERTVTDTEVFTARTEAVQSVDVKARVTGYLTKLLFVDGADVKEGDELFEIDNRPYAAKLDEAKANLALSKAALTTAQAEYDIGLGVQKINAAAISVAQLDLRLGQRDEAAAAVKRAEAALQDAQLNYNWCRVTSPITGRINTHFVDVGNMVSADVTTLTNIVSLQPIWAYFDVDENTALKYQALVASGAVKSVRKNQIPVAMAMENDKGFPFTGMIDFVSNQLDPNTGSIRLRAEFANKDENLLAGMFGRIRVPSSAPHQALLVNDQAIGTNQGQSYVLVVNGQHEVEYRPVDVGQLHDGLREVMRFRSVTEPGPQGKDITKQVEVLNPQELVIVDGLQRVRPGEKVEARLVNMTTLLVQPQAAAGSPATTH